MCRQLVADGCLTNFAVKMSSDDKNDNVSKVKIALNNDNESSVESDGCIINISFVNA